MVFSYTALGCEQHLRDLSMDKYFFPVAFFQTVLGWHIRDCFCAILLICLLHVFYFLASLGISRCYFLFVRGLVIAVDELIPALPYYNALCYLVGSVYPNNIDSKITVAYFLQQKLLHIERTQFYSSSFCRSLSIILRSTSAIEIPHFLACLLSQLTWPAVKAKDRRFVFMGFNMAPLVVSVKETA